MNNRHTIDELANVREEIKILSLRETELKEVILADPGNLDGDEYFADLKTSTSKRVDRKLLDVRFGKSAVDECCKESTSTTIRLVRREAHAEDG